MQGQNSQQAFSPSTSHQTDTASPVSLGSLAQEAVEASDKLQMCTFCLPVSLAFLLGDSTMPAMNGMPAHLIAQAARQHKADSHAEHQMNKVRDDDS